MGGDEWQILLFALRRLDGLLHLGGEPAISEPLGGGFRVAAKVGLSGSGEGLVAKSWVADVASPGDGCFRVLSSVAVGKSFDGEIAFGGVGHGEKVICGGDGVAVFPFIEGGIETIFLTVAFGKLIEPSDGSHRVFLGPFTSDFANSFGGIILVGEFFNPSCGPFGVRADVTGGDGVHGGPFEWALRKGFSPDGSSDWTIGPESFAGDDIHKAVGILASFDAEGGNVFHGFIAIPAGKTGDDAAFEEGFLFEEVFGELGQHGDGSFWVVGGPSVDDPIEILPKGLFLAVTACSIRGHGIGKGCPSGDGTPSVVKVGPFFGYFATILNPLFGELSSNGGGVFSGHSFEELTESEASFYGIGIGEGFFGENLDATL